MSTEKPRRLGRGLEALIGRPSNDPVSTQQGLESTPASALRHIAMDRIVPNPLQPRKEFVADDLRDLETSIRANGLLQPITVRSTAHGFELIAGERRFRAIQQLGWREIPAIVKEENEVSDKTLLTLALVENLQRADLNPMEEADGYQNLISQFALTQQQVADVVGKDRSTIANTLRLLALPAAVRQMVRGGVLTIGHARALLALVDDHRMVDLAKTIATEGLSVREVERRVREAGARYPVRVPANARDEAKPPASIAHMEEGLRKHLQTDVKIRLTSKDKGEVRIPFFSVDDLERVLDLLLGATREAL